VGVGLRVGVAFAFISVVAGALGDLAVPPKEDDVLCPLSSGRTKLKLFLKHYQKKCLPGLSRQAKSL
jgi:hypothetical protein